MTITTATITTPGPTSPVFYPADHGPSGGHAQRGVPPRPRVRVDLPGRVAPAHGRPALLLGAGRAVRQPPRGPHHARRRRRRPLAPARRGAPARSHRRADHRRARRGCGPGGRPADGGLHRPRGPPPARAALVPRVPRRPAGAAGLASAPPCCRRRWSASTRRAKPAYLEATSADNRRLYERHGFEVVRERQLPLAPPCGGPGRLLRPLSARDDRQTSGVGSIVRITHAPLAPADPSVAGGREPPAWWG